MDVLKISDEKVKFATKKTWKQWFSILDKFKAREQGHYATAKYLEQKHKVSGWWAQSITVRYEKVNKYWVRHGK